METLTCAQWGSYPDREQQLIPQTGTECTRTDDLCVHKLKSELAL